LIRRCFADAAFPKTGCRLFSVRLLGSPEQTAGRLAYLVSGACRRPWLANQEAIMPSLSRRFRRSLLAFAVAALAPLPATAEIFDARLIGGFYQQTTTTISAFPPTESPCTNVSACFVVFSRIPNSKQLIVTNVSCSLSTSSGDLAFTRLIPQRPDGSILFHFQFLEATRAVGDVFTFNNTVVALFDARERPLIQVAPSANATISSVACTIAGQLIDKP
jgi:hypothetical protein